MFILFVSHSNQTLCNIHCNIYFCTQQIRNCVCCACVPCECKNVYRIESSIYCSVCSTVVAPCFALHHLKFLQKKRERKENCMAHIMIEMMQFLIMKNDVLFLFDALYCSQFFGWRTHHAILLLDSYSTCICSSNNQIAQYESLSHLKCISHHTSIFMRSLFLLV